MNYYFYESVKSGKKKCIHVGARVTYRAARVLNRAGPITKKKMFFYKIHYKFRNTDSYLLLQHFNAVRIQFGGHPIIGLNIFLILKF